MTGTRIVGATTASYVRCFGNCGGASRGDSGDGDGGSESRGSGSIHVDVRVTIECEPNCAPEPETVPNNWRRSVLGERGLSVLPFAPGYDLTKCAILLVGGLNCGGGEWTMAGIGLSPGGRAAAKGVDLLTDVAKSADALSVTARFVPRVDGPVFDQLKDHAGRHSTLHPNVYYNAAVKHLETGTQFKFRHDGQFKNAFVTRTGADSFAFTSASRSGDRIFTHMDDVSTQYLRNIGITLPKGF